MTGIWGKLHLYWETVRPLKPVQIYGRMLFRLTRPKPDPRPTPPVRDPMGVWMPPARRPASQTGPDAFRFLNETRSLAAHGWDDPAVGKLWRYNLHYFDDLNAEDAGERSAWHQALIARWIAENPPGAGTGWEPYPTSLRIVNWIKWARGGGGTLTPAALHSLAVQARWLTRRLEHHLQGNHLFSNAKALVFAGAVFEGPEAEGWLKLGLDILRQQIPLQILADGGQFELTPMYHALALEDVLDLVNVVRSAGLTAPDPWLNQVQPMRRWLNILSHGDGQIAFFNDAAIGVAPSPAELEAYAIRLGFAPSQGVEPGCIHLADSGYIRLQDDRAVVLIDVAQVGPDYLSGHGHADVLSFELSLDGRRVMVNSGTSVYETGPERLRQRGTAAHNTVTVDGADSSEVWSSFRVGRLARPRDLTIRREDGLWRVACAHDGYRRLPGRPRHRREWTFGQGHLVIEDHVESTHAQAEAAFHLHPDLSCAAADDVLSGSLTRRGAAVVAWRVDRGAPRLEPSTWHPEFGLSLASRKLVVRLEDGESRMALSWEDD